MLFFGLFATYYKEIKKVKYMENLHLFTICGYIKQQR